MTYREKFSLPAELLERVSEQRFDILPELIQVIINAAMQAERQQYLKAEPYLLKVWNDCIERYAVGLVW